jgi:hypothetical protein
MEDEMAKKPQVTTPVKDSVQHRNDAIKQSLKGMIPELEDSRLRIDFYCECHQNTCLERIGLLVNEYEHIHRDARRLMVKPQHVSPSHTIIERHGSYWVVLRTD